jgi:uncharacterized protein (DUF433 family)
MIETRYEHIVLDERQVPIITGTTIKVIEVVLDKIAYGWSPEEIHLQHPHLSLGQIHSALAYYWDHKTELDNVIEQDFQYVEQLRKTSQPTPFQRRLRDQGLLP